MAYPEPQLKELSKLLERMTRPDGRPSYVPQLGRWNQRAQRGLIVMTVLGTFAIAIASGVVQHRAGETPGRGHYGWALLALLPAMGYLLLMIYNGVVLLWQEYRKPWGTIYQQFMGDLCADAAYVAELKRFPKELLEYALLHYRHRWSRVDGRTSLLAGDIRKIGLFPGLLAILVAAPKLLDGRSTAWAWQLLALIGAFQLIAFAVAATSERRTQVIDLLQHAIDYADSVPTEAAIFDDEQQPKEQANNDKASNPDLSRRQRDPSPK